MNKFLMSALLCLTTLNAQTPEEQIASFKQNPHPTLVKVTASWCGPCRNMEPALNAVKEAFEGKVSFANFAVEDLMKGNDAGIAALNNEFGIKIRSIPTFLLFKDGKLVKVLIGSRTKENLTEWLDKLIKTTTEELLKEEREDIPEELRKAFQGPSKEELIQIKKEMTNVRDFLTNPEKYKDLHSTILESDVFKRINESIEMIEKEIEQTK